MEYGREEYKKAKGEFEKLPKEVQEKIKKESAERKDFIVKMYPDILQARASNGKNMVAIMSMGSMSQEYCKRFKCSIAELMSNIAIYEKLFNEGLKMLLGIRRPGPCSAQGLPLRQGLR